MTASASATPAPTRRIDTFMFSDGLYGPAELERQLNRDVAVVRQLCAMCDTYAVVAVGTVLIVNIDEDTVTNEMHDIVAQLTVSTDRGDVTLEGDKLTGLYYMSLGDLQAFLVDLATLDRSCGHLGPFTSLDELRNYTSPIEVQRLACGSGDCNAWISLAAGVVTIKGSMLVVDGEEFSLDILDDVDYTVADARYFEGLVPDDVECVHS